MPNSRTVSRTTGRTPKYQRIAATLRAEIAGEYQPGDVLPSEHSLASRFNVNRHTVRRGVDELVQDGLLVRQRGRGTVVLSTPIDFPITMNKRFSELVRETGRSTSNRLLTKKVSRAPAEAAEALGLADSEEVVFLEQVRLMGEMALAISRHWLPVTRFRFLIDRFHGGSLHRIIGQEHGIRIRLRRAMVTAQFPTADDALNLRLSPRVPVITAQLIDVDAASGDPVEFTEQVFRADATRLSVEPGPDPSIAALHG